MANSLKQIIFQKYFSPLDAKTDPNKDVDGKGTMQRFVEIVGEDVDNSLLPLVENFIAKIYKAETMDSRLIPFREQAQGNDIFPFLLSGGDAMRRRIIRHWRWLVGERGTKVGMIKLFAWLGITAVITEINDTGGFDSATTFDSDVRPVFDSGKCRSCSFYQLDLTGPLLTEELWFGILSIIAFHEPIHAELYILTYNGLSLLPPPAYNFTYSTAFLGIHTPSLFGATDTVWSFESGFGGYRFGEEPDYSYGSGATKLVGVYVMSPAALTAIDFSSEAIIGSVILSLMTGLVSYNMANNPLLTNVTFPATAVVVTLLDVSGTGLVNLDLSLFTALGGTIKIGQTASLVAIFWSAAQSTAETYLFDASGTAYNGVIDLDKLLLGAGCVITVVGSAINDFSTGSVVNLGSIAEVTVRGNAGLGFVNIANLRGEVLSFDISNNAAIFNLTLGAAFVRGAGEFRADYTPALVGTHDLSTFPVKDHLSFSNSGILQLVYAADGSPISMYDLRSCPNLQYHSITNLGGLLEADDAEAHLENCTLTAPECTSFLTDMVSIITARAEAPGGDFTGRSVSIGGNNAALNAGGLAQVVTLNSYGVTVSHN